MFRILKKVFSLDKFFVRTAESILSFLGLALIGYAIAYVSTEGISSDGTKRGAPRPKGLRFTGKSIGSW